MSLIEVSPRNAYTDPKTGLRFYRWGDQDYPSVTSIRRMSGMPFNLHEWTITQVVNRAVDEIATLNEMLARPRRLRERVLDKNRAKEMKSWLRKAATEERDKASALGTAVHDAAAAGLHVPDADPEVQPRLTQFYCWLADSKATILATERQVWNLTVGYAGTFDLICRMPDGAIFLVDLKTGKGIFAEHALQCMAYSMAEFAGNDGVIDEEVTDLLLNLNGIAILHLSDEGYVWQEIDATPALWRAFRGLHAFAMFMYEHPDMTTLGPTEISGIVEVTA